MRIITSTFLKKTWLMFKCLYLVWLTFCFLFWFLLTFDIPQDIRNRYAIFFDLVDFFFDSREIEGFLFYSPLWLLIIFIINSIVKRKVSIWECWAIIIIWAMVIYVSPHLRT